MQSKKEIRYITGIALNGSTRDKKDVLSGNFKAIFRVRKNRLPETIRLQKNKQLANELQKKADNAYQINKKQAKQYERACDNIPNWVKKDANDAWYKLSSRQKKKISKKDFFLEYYNNNK